MNARLTTSPVGGALPARTRSVVVFGAIPAPYPHCSPSRLALLAVVLVLTRFSPCRAGGLFATLPLCAA